MTSRTYDQFCGVARALDLVGERWALLLVRDLLLGPKRFTDLRRGLPRIGTNVLAARLQELERNGVDLVLRTEVETLIGFLAGADVPAVALGPEGDETLLERLPHVFAFGS